MKTTKLIIAMASMMMLASCGGNAPASTTDASTESSITSEAKKTMDFLKDGEYYAYIPTEVLDPVDGHVPAIRVNGTSINGGRTGEIGEKFELAAEGEFLHDVYVVVAKSEREGHIAANVYGALDKDELNEALATVANAVGTPNKVYISFSTTKNSWFRNLDTEMDEEIEFAWGLLGE